MDAKDDVAPWIVRMARVGYVAKAVLYGTVGLFAAGAAIGQGESTDSRGAMAKVASAPFGRVLLVMMAGGLLGYAIWRITSAIVDAERRGNGAKGLSLRASFFVRGLVHLGLAYSAARLAMGSKDGGSSGQHSERAAGAAMSLPGGTSILWIASASLAGFGLYQLYRAVTAKLSKQLDFGELRAETGSWLIGVSRFGIAARGLVFVAAAWLFGAAAATHDPSRAGGIADALDIVSRFGRWAYALTGAGLIAYGVYELVNARYRRVEAVR